MTYMGAIQNYRNNMLEKVYEIGIKEYKKGI